MKAAVTNSDQRHELIVIVFDEKDVAISDFEFRRVSHQHCFIPNCATEHLNHVRVAGFAFDVVRNLKRDVSLNVTLRSFTFPN